MVEPDRPEISIKTGAEEKQFACCITKARIQILIILNIYEERPKNNRNLNVAHEVEVAARCAARCRESTQ
jgi:hypothetical protein